MSSSSPRAPDVEPRVEPGNQSNPQQRLYFPVETYGPGDYEPWRASQVALSEFCLDVDAERERYLTHKRSIVQRVGRGPLRVKDDGAERAQLEAAKFLRASMLELPAWRGQSEALADMELDELMMQLQEDLVIMQCPAGHAPERARAVYLHVCFPSGWVPARLLGKSFPALHARVPYEPGFERAERALHAGQLFAEPAARYVWTVAPFGSLDRHPEQSPVADWPNATQAFLRVERQILLPLAAASLAAESTALFLIRVYVYPVERLSVEQRRVLLAGVNALPESMRRYKGLLGHEERLRQLSI